MAMCKEKSRDSASKTEKQLFDSLPLFIDWYPGCSKACAMARFRVRKNFQVKLISCSYESASLF